MFTVLSVPACTLVNVARVISDLLILSVIILAASTRGTAS
jgi:hypothetical protein